VAEKKSRTYASGSGDVLMILQGLSIYAKVAINAPWNLPQQWPWWEVLAPTWVALGVLVVGLVIMGLVKLSES
jgi:hypothetical protein